MSERGSIAFEMCWLTGHSHDWRDCPTPENLVCKHGETEGHHFTAPDYPCPGLWWCRGPNGDDDA